MTTARKSPPTAFVRDPVCSMRIDPMHACATRAYGDVVVSFCSQACFEESEEVPEQYLLSLREHDDESTTPRRGTR